MNYKNLFKIALLLISSPVKAWEEIRLEEDRQKVFTEFVYPMIGFCGLAVFIGTLLEKGWGEPQSFQVAMTQCCAVAVSMFGGYFLAAYAINELMVQMFKMRSDIRLIQQFAGYALVVTFLIKIVTGLMPDFLIVGWLLQFYIIFVAWEGASTLVNVHENKRFSFTILSSLILIVCPAAIQFVFNWLTLALN